VFLFLGLVVREEGRERAEKRGRRMGFIVRVGWVL
jgi:hypothetical protein